MHGCFLKGMMFTFPEQVNDDEAGMCLSAPFPTFCPTSLPCAAWLTCFLKGVMFTFPE